MLPKWITNLLDREACVKCGQSMVEARVVGIGLRRSQNLDQEEPEVFLGAKCPSCDARHMYVATAPLPAFLASVTQLYWHFGGDKKTLKESLPLSALDFFAFQVAEDYLNDFDNTEPTSPQPPEAETQGPVMPSKRKGQPQQPISDREMMVFMNILNRTSFKITTKSFSNWMRRMHGKD